MRAESAMFSNPNGDFIMTKRSRVAASLVIAAVLVLAGCDQAKAPAPQPPESAARPPAVIELTAMDYAFTSPDTIPGGWVTLRLSNTGKELHHAALYRLDGGKTAADLLKLAPPAMTPGWLVAAGGPNPAGPGGSVETTLKLTPGNYAILCEVPSPDGKLHVMKGMVKPLTVVAPLDSAIPPAADLSLKLADYSFEFSGPLTAGKHTFRVETAPGQPHEIVMVRLPPGKKAEDLLAWVAKMAGPPPIERIVGGTTALGQGEVAVFQGELAAGNYAVICFIPDAKDGQPHAVHGMMKTFTVL